MTVLRYQGGLHFTDACASLRLSVALCIRTVHNFIRDYYYYYTLKITTFSLWPELAIDLNRHFFVNKYGNLELFLLFF